MVTVKGSHASTREARSSTAGESLGTQKKRKKTANSKPSEQMVTVEGSHVSIMEANSEMVTVEGSHASTREARSYTAGESLGTQKCHK